MIPFDFAYYRPATIDEAVQTYVQLASEGTQALYYSGGSEIITLGRINRLFTQAVIDLKAIPECRALQTADGEVTIGAALPIIQVVEANLFPLLSGSAGRIADHTSRCTITVGGNICGTFVYREAVLAFLVADSQMVIAGPQGLRSQAVTKAFHKRLHLAPGEFLVQVKTDSKMTLLPHKSVKKTRQDYINYPLVSVAMLWQEGQIRLAVSGLLDYPFRSEQMEQALNATEWSLEERINRAIDQLPGPIISDVEGSAGYREFVFRNLLQENLGISKGVS